MPHLPPVSVGPLLTSVLFVSKTKNDAVSGPLEHMGTVGISPKLLLVDLTQGFPERQKSW